VEFQDNYAMCHARRNEHLSVTSVLACAVLSGLQHLVHQNTATSYHCST